MKVVIVGCGSKVRVFWIAEELFALILTKYVDCGSDCDEEWSWDLDCVGEPEPGPSIEFDYN